MFERNEGWGGLRWKNNNRSEPSTPPLPFCGFEWRKKHLPFFCEEVLFRSCLIMSPLGWGPIGSKCQRRADRTPWLKSFSANSKRQSDPSSPSPQLGWLMSSLPLFSRVENVQSDPSALVTRERGSSSSVFTQFSYAASPAALLLRLVRTVFIVLFIFQSFQHLNQDFNVIKPKRKFDDYQFCNVFKYTPKSTPHPNLADLFINIADQRTGTHGDGDGPLVWSHSSQESTI